jgi:nitrous oxidase accessory protein NosD
LADFRLLAPLTVLLGVLLIAPAASASHVQCGDTINQDTTLDSDLVCAGDGLRIGDEVTLDLAGHSITGSGTGTGVQCFCTNFELRGGRIRGFGDGVFAEGASVSRMLFEENGTGLDCEQGLRCFVEDTTFRHNRNALRLDAPDSNPVGAVRRNRIYDNGSGVSIIGYDAPVTDNYIAGNDGDGIWAYYEAELQVSRNVVVDNLDNGIHVEFLGAATITHNRIMRNGNGVRVQGDYSFGHTRADVRDNRIAANASDGVLVDNAAGADGTVIAGNRTDRNGDDGIGVSLDPAAPYLDGVEVTLAGNRASFNSDLGIEAVVGTTDGGGNRARHNGNPAQCVGVSCK